jgi:hypothetical protein
MLRIVLIALALAACGSSQPTPTSTTLEPTPTTVEPTPTTPEPTAGTTGKADGASCLAAEECESGVCEGEGCGADQPGTCMPKSRACTRDLRPYCGCDGQTFRTSGSCPGKRFSARAECP